MPQTPEQSAVLQELYRRRESLDPQRQAVVDELMRRQQGAPAAAPQPSLFQRAAQLQSHIATETAGGVWDTIKGAATMLTPTSGSQLAAMAFGGPAGLTTAKALEAQFAEADKARQAAEQGRTSEALAYSATAGLPVAGPLISHVGESLGQGKGLRLVGEAAAMAAMGKAGGAIAGEAPVYSLRRSIKLDAKAKNTLIREFRPPANDARFEQSLDKAVPELAEQARISKADPNNPIPSTMDFLGLLRGAKKRLWAEREKFIAPHRPSIQISGEVLAKAIEKGATKLLKEDNPAGYQALRERANSYRSKTYDLHSAEMLLKDLNLELHKYYQKGPLDKLTISEATEVARLRRMGESLRKEIYSKVDAVAGPGVAELMKRYGAASDLELYADPLVRDIQRYGGKDLGAMATEGIFDTAAGSIYSRSGALVRGGRAIGRMLGKGTDAKIAGAFKQLGRYRPYTPTVTGGPPQPGPTSGLWSPTQRALPPGGTPIPRPAWARYWEPPPANIPGQPPPPRPSFVKGFQAPWGEPYPMLRKLLPATAGPTEIPITPTPRYAPATPQSVLRSLLEPRVNEPKLLPSGPPAPYPQPPTGPSRGMQFEGAFPLEGQVSPEAIPRTPSPNYPSGYVPVPETSFVEGVPAEWGPIDYPTLMKLFRRAREGQR